MRRSLTRRSIAMFIGLLSAVAFVHFVDTNCALGPLRGPNYGAESHPYLQEGSLVAEPADELAHRLILAGDAGDVRPDSPVLPLLTRWGDEHGDRTTVLFLGDNVYPAGLQETDAAAGKEILRILLGATTAFKLFLPGNHDWGSRWQQGRKEIVANQQAFIENHGPAADFVPKNGCPGPDVIDLLDADDRLTGGLAIVALDLHWWLLAESRRPPCSGIDSTTVFVDKLKAVLERYRDRNLVVAAHHPLKTAGPHGGHSRGFWADLGIAISYRFYSLQDLIEPNYAEMVAVLTKVLAEHPPLATVAGHDHNLQVLDGGDVSEVAIVSGAFSRTSTVTAIADTLFAHAHLGFVVMDFYGRTGSPGILVVRVIESGRQSQQVFSAQYDLRAPRPESLEAADVRQ